MNRTTRTIAVTAALAMAATLFTPDALGQGRTGLRTPRIRSTRTMTAPKVSRSVRLPQSGSYGTRMPHGLGRSSRTSNLSNLSGLGALGGLGGLSALGGATQAGAPNLLDVAGLLGQLGGLGGMGGLPWDSGHDPYYRAEKAHADAYRDAAIANAVVNLVGILVTASQNQNAVAQTVAIQPQAVAVQPQVVQVQPQQPQGYYESRRVLVKEGRYEEYQVWVPETIDPVNNVRVMGHHETHRRWVPEVYEEQRVWVQPQP